MRKTSNTREKTKMKRDALLLVLAEMIEARSESEINFERSVLERIAFCVELNNPASVKSMHECAVSMMSKAQVTVLNEWLKSEGYFV